MLMLVVIVDFRFGRYDNDLEFALIYFHMHVRFHSVPQPVAIVGVGGAALEADKALCWLFLCHLVFVVLLLFANC